MQREAMTEKEKRQKAYSEEWRMRMYGVTVEATAVCANCEYFGTLNKGGIFLGMRTLRCCRYKRGCKLLPGMRKKAAEYL